MIRQLAVFSVIGTLTVAVAGPALFQEMTMPSPTEHHAQLQKSVGHWEGTITMTMPGMGEMVSPASEDVRSGGPFWTISDFKSDMGGMPYSGHGCHGFDPEKGKYVSTWIDNMTSYLNVMEGSLDEESGMIVMEWNAPDMTGAMAPHRSEQKMSDDAYTMTFYTSGEQTMVIDMKKTAAKPVEASSER